MRDTQCQKWEPKYPKIHSTDLPKSFEYFLKKASSGVRIIEYVVQRLQAICPAELSLVSRESLLKTASGKISLAFLIPP